MKEHFLGTLLIGGDSAYIYSGSSVARPEEGNIIDLSKNTTDAGNLKENRKYWLPSRSGTLLFLSLLPDLLGITYLFENFHVVNHAIAKNKVKQIND